jgi:hypothetical protein
MQTQLAHWRIDTLVFLLQLSRPHVGAPYLLLQPAYRRANRQRERAQLRQDVRLHCQRDGELQQILPNILSETENDVPVPINIDAGGGGALLAPAWNGVAAEVGNDSIITRTDRWSSLDSVKNFACRPQSRQSYLNM